MEEHIVQEENGNYRYYSPDGMFFRTPQYVGWDGREVEKTPDKYRYSYDAYVTHKFKDEYEDAVYSDRLWQWDPKKHDSLCQEHFGNQGQYWDGRSPEKIEAFLRDYNNNPKLTLVGIMTGANASSGFPYWVFMFDNNK